MEYFTIATTFAFLIFIFPICNGLTITKERIISREINNVQETAGLPVIQTIQGTDGDILDCVDINMQPALQHPLLKNHTIKMTPSSIPKNTNEKYPSRVIESSISTVSCPYGTIPILRTGSEHELSKFPSIPMFGDHMMQNNSQNSETIIRVYDAMYGTEGKCHGTKASLIVYEPNISGSNQHVYSAGDAILHSGQKNTFDFISSGWIVYPSIFGDNHARFYTIWNNNPKMEDICVNLMCPGFVQVSREIPLGARVRPVSVLGGNQYAITVQLFKDLDNNTGDWWLTFGETNKLIGYWPKELFTYLQKDNIIVGWGGEVQAPSNELSPPMSSGCFPSEGFGKTAFVKNTKIVNENDELINPAISNLVKSTNKPECYQVGEVNREKEGISFYFGGPGGCKD